MNIPAPLLFSREDLGDFLNRLHQRLLQRIADIPDSQMRTDKLEDIVDPVVKEHTISAPVLGDSKEISDSGDIFLDVEDFGQTVKVPHNYYVVAVPFEGEAYLFNCRPSQWTSRSPRGEVSDGEILMTFVYRTANAEQLKKDIDDMVDQIKRYLSWVGADIASYNGQVRSVVTAAVQARVQKMEAASKLLTELGIPVRKKTQSRF